jgi:hypothetical protein
MALERTFQWARRRSSSASSSQVIQHKTLLPPFIFEKNIILMLKIFYSFRSGECTEQPCMTPVCFYIAILINPCKKWRRVVYTFFVSNLKFGAQFLSDFHLTFCKWQICYLLLIINYEKTHSHSVEYFWVMPCTNSSRTSLIVLVIPGQQFNLMNLVLI